MTEFEFDETVDESRWLVEGLIPMGHLSIVLAKAGVGKSLLVESIATHVVYGEDFCDLPTEEGDVLIIDQDTPTEVIKRRLTRLSRAFGKDRKHKLFLESMRGLAMNDKTLTTCIRDHSTAKLVVIDCLHSICGKYNPNNTSDMSQWSRIKSACLTRDNTILLNHHISEKQDLTIESLMQGEAGKLSMGASSIIQQADTYYIVGADAENGRTNKIYMRPVSKRLSIASKPLIARLADGENDSEVVVFGGYYEPDLDDVQQDILTLFKEQKTDRTVKEVYEAMGHKHGENAIRKALNECEKKGLLLLSRHKANLFKYKLP